MNKIAYLGAVKFKTKDYKYLGTLLIFTPFGLSMLLRVGPKMTNKTLVPMGIGLVQATPS